MILIGKLFIQVIDKIYFLVQGVTQKLPKEQPCYSPTSPRSMHAQKSIVVVDLFFEVEA